MSNFKLSGASFLFVVLMSVLTVQSAAQQNDSAPGLLESLKDFFKRDYLSIGMLLQSRGEFHWAPDAPGQNTFRIASARLKLSGELDGGITYMLQTAFTGSPSLVDAKIKLPFSEHFAVTAGAQKPGISAEYLRSASNTDFINRSRVVRALVNNRDVGILAEIEPSPGISLSGGIFNGTNQNLTNNNNSFYYTGRFEINSGSRDDTYLQFGVNAGHGFEDGTFIGNRSLPAITGERTVAGADVRLESGRLMISSELLTASLDYVSSPVDRVTGYHVTGGYRITDALQVLVRLDHIESDLVTFTSSDLLLAGLNYDLTEAAGFQLNYQVDPDNYQIDHHALWVQMQIAF